MNINVKRAVVLVSKGDVDKITLHLEAPTMFPSMGYEPYLTAQTAQGLGIIYCRDVFGIEPEVITVKNK
jgi:hypothetical protein